MNAFANQFWKLSRAFPVALAGIIGVACYATLGRHGSSLTQGSPRLVETTLPPAVLLPAEDARTEQVLRLFSQRVQRDPEDFVAQNMLAGAYLQRLHETGNEDHLPLALQAARASVASVPVERNFGGLLLLGRAEFANHGFAEARDHAQRLAQLDPGKAEAQALLGDSFLELGDYEKAAQAFQKMQELGERSVEAETRLARLALLRGHPDRARAHFSTALLQLLALPSPPRETTAWCRWQLGETAFSVGDYQTAERHYRDALITAPGYFRAVASLGRVAAARADWSAASDQYQQAIRTIPAHEFVAALADVFRLRGQESSALALQGTVEQIAEHTRTVHGTAHNRNLAVFYADHGLQPEKAYALAAAEYATRKDIYGADALAWTALKAGRLQEAQAAIREALRLGTQDARLFYHAGMIAAAGQDKPGARQYLQRALALNPQFDPLQAARARAALKNS